MADKFNSCDTILYPGSCWIPIAALPQLQFPDRFEIHFFLAGFIRVTFKKNIYLWF